MLNFLNISAQFCIISLLSCWLNQLYRQNKSELSFPHKYPYPWQWRAIKIFVITGTFLLLITALLPNSLISSNLMAIYGIFSYQPSNGLLTDYGFFFVLYSSFLLIMMWSDMEQQIIMNPQLALFAILGLCYQLLLQPDQLFLQLITALASGLIFLLLAILTRGGIGGGDIKLLAALGLWLKPEAMEVTGIGGIILGGLLALMAILSKKKKPQGLHSLRPWFYCSCSICLFPANTLATQISPGLWPGDIFSLD